MTTSPLLRLALTAGACVALALPAAARQAPPRGGQAPAGANPTAPPTPIFGEQIEVRVVNVEVVVTDRSGHRVPDLASSDFRLRIDGKTLPIEYFSEVRGGQAIAAAPGAATRQAVRGLPDLAPGSPVGTSYLVFVDDFFSVEVRRNEVLRSLKDDLAKLGPEDRMAIVAFDGRRLSMLSSWSSSQRDLARAIDKEIGNPAFGLNRQAELRSYDSSGELRRSIGIAPTARGAFMTRLSIEEIAYAEQLGQQVERVVSGAVSALHGFASPPGRKVMLLLAGGWPFSPAEYVVNDLNRPILGRDVPRGEDLLKPLVETANRIGYTLYPVDVPGLETVAADASADSPRTPSQSFGLREQEHEGSLQFIADRTGGKALLNSLRIAALDHVEADTRSYYWLGFTPTWQGNDKRHKIEVEVLRPGLKARARDSFLDRSRKSEISMMVESAMLFGNPTGSAGMAVQVGQPMKTRRGEMAVTVKLAIPADAITTVPLDGRYAAQLELRVAAVGDRGGRSDIPVIPLQLSFKEPPASGKYVPYETRLLLRREPHHLTFAVFDTLSNKIITAEADVKP